MARYKWLNLILTLLILTSCRKSLPDLEGFDKKIWAEDKNGCQNKRSTMATALENEKEKLLSLSEMEIVTILGRPDQNELSRRHQKLFGYHLFPSKDCSGNKPEIERKLIIRFNAMGLAKEVAIE